MIDAAGRTIDYMRISITDRCNLRCRYCMPDGITQVSMSEILTYEEIRKVNGDSTIMINKMSFDVPSQYIGTSIIIRYDPVRYTTIYLYDPANKIQIPLKNTDKVENGKTRRTEIIY